MHLFLCSHFSSVGSAIKEQITGKKVLFIPTASIHEGYTGYVGSARNVFKKSGALLTEVDISSEAFPKIQTLFEDADIIYFTGGNSFFLIDQLRKTGADKLLKQHIENGKFERVAYNEPRVGIFERFDIILKSVEFRRCEQIPIGKA